MVVWKLRQVVGMACSPEELKGGLEYLKYSRYMFGKLGAGTIPEQTIETVSGMEMYLRQHTLTLPISHKGRELSGYFNGRHGEHDFAGMVFPSWGKAVVLLGPRVMQGLTGLNERGVREGCERLDARLPVRSEPSSTEGIEFLAKWFNLIEFGRVTPATNRLEFLDSLAITTETTLCRRIREFSWESSFLQLFPYEANMEEFDRRVGGVWEKIGRGLGVKPHVVQRVVMRGKG